MSIEQNREPQQSPQPDETLDQLPPEAVTGEQPEQVTGGALTGDGLVLGTLAKGTGNTNLGNTNLANLSNLKNTNL